VVLQFTLTGPVAGCERLIVKLSTLVPLLPSVRLGELIDSAGGGGGSVVGGGGVLVGGTGVCVGGGGGGVLVGGSGVCVGVLIGWSVLVGVLGTSVCVGVLIGGGVSVVVGVATGGSASVAVGVAITGSVGVTVFTRIGVGVSTVGEPVGAGLGVAAEGATSGGVLVGS
jgi:hypothetical protein